MNSKDLLATLVKALSDAEAKDKLKARKSPAQNLAKAPSKKSSRSAGRAQGLISLTCLVPKRVYKIVVEHCRENEITISYYLRTLVDAALGTDMTDVATNGHRTASAFPKRKQTYRSKKAPARPRGRSGPAPAHTDEEIGEFIALFHKEQPSASAQQIFAHLRKEYGMKFEHNRAMAILKKIRAQALNGKSENVG